MGARKNTTPIALFWSKVSIVDRDECWEWTAGRDRDGYGMFSLSRHQVRAHRIAADQAGILELSSPLFVLHSCDNPPCCNPAHLMAGTAKDNAIDASLKGRVARGERNSLSKLTRDRVHSIRARLSRGETCASIAKDMGVSSVTISNVRTGRVWSWLP